MSGSRTSMGLSSIGKAAAALLLVWCGYLLVAGTVPVASASAPGWEIKESTGPTTFSESDCDNDASRCDHYFVRATNVGAAPTHGLITLKGEVPAGLEILPSYTFAEAIKSENSETLDCSINGQAVECTHEGVLAPEDLLRLYMSVAVEPGTPAGPLGLSTASIEGGGAPTRSASAAGSVEVPQEYGPTDFGFKPYSSDGVLDARASAHPNSLGSDFAISTKHITDNLDEGEGASLGIVPFEEMKGTLFYLPPGFAGDPNAVPYCRLAVVEQRPETCPKASRVGSAEALFEYFGFQSSINENGSVSPIYNVAPQDGYPAEFAFTVENKLAVLYTSLVHAGGVEGGYQLRVGTAGIPNIRAFRVMGVWLRFFGDPSTRNESQLAERAFLTNPSNCAAGPLSARVETNSWQRPNRWVGAEETVYPQLSGCDELQFQPTVTVSPGTAAADSPAGLKVGVHVPQTTQFEERATPQLRDATVKLPEGLVINPSSADGLGACKATGPEGINIGTDQIGPAGADLGNPEATELGAGHTGGNSSPYDDGVYHTARGHCPPASTLAGVEVRTPLLPDPLQGHIYLGTPACGPCTGADASDGKLVRLYMEIVGSGVIAKLPGTVSVDPVTGQLTGTFEQNPQLPFEDLELDFHGGPRAALTSPQACGAYTATSEIVPWSAPDTPSAEPTSSFAINSGPNGSACVQAPGPNNPAFTAGTLNPSAGSYSPFVLKLSRQDGTQRLKGIDTTLPPGLIGKLAGIPYCPEAQIAAAEHNSGQGEKAAPSCPLASEVGAVNVGAGSGPNPFYAQGHAYLAGPYKGAPLSLAVITPAVAGPFDLGTVVVRTALYVDPETTQITAKSDPLPTILAGIPLDVRSIALHMNRPSFTLNPTNCSPMAITATAIGQSSGAALSSPFQVGGCNSLGFKPKLAIKLTGGTKRGKNPALRAVLTYPKGSYANIAKASVALPHSEFLEQGHIKTICTRVQFSEGAVPGEKCPAASVYGYARATTPLLDMPLEGPVFLRSSSHELPDLVAALGGQINVAIAGRIDTDKKGGIRSSFEMVPDAPVSKFTLTMKGGKKGLLVNSENICRKPQRATAKFDAQNGRTSDFNPLIGNTCKKKSRKGKHQKTHQHPGG